MHSNSGTQRHSIISHLNQPCNAFMRFFFVFHEVTITQAEKANNVLLIRKNQCMMFASAPVLHVLLPLNVDGAKVFLLLNSCCSCRNVGAVTDETKALTVSVSACVE